MLSLPHRLGWQSTVGYLVQPGNTRRSFVDTEVRVFPLFSLRHCLPVVGQLTQLEQYDAIIPGCQRTDVYPRENHECPIGFPRNVTRQARNKVPEDMMERLPHFIGDGWKGQNHPRVTFRQPSLAVGELQ